MTAAPVPRVPPAPPAPPRLPGWRLLQTLSLLVALGWLAVGGALGARWVQREMQAERAGRETQLQTLARNVALLAEQKLQVTEHVGQALALQDSVPEAAARLLRARPPDWAERSVAERRQHLLLLRETAELSTLLERLQRPLGLRQIFLLDTQGDCIASSTWQDPTSCLGGNYRERPYFRQALAQGASRQFAVGQRVREPSLFFGTRVGRASAPLGVLVVRSAPSELTALLPREGVQALLVDPAGVVVASDDPGQWLRQVPLVPPPPPALLRATYGVEAVRSIPLARQGAIWWLDGAEVLHAQAELAGGTLSALLLAPVRELERTRDGLWRTAAAVLVLGLLAVALAERVLDDAQRQAAYAEALEAAHRDLQGLAQELHALATTDALSGVANRRHFMDRLALELERAARSGQPLALLMLDIDHFKRINDTRGHAAGDAVIQALAQRCAAALRPYDLLARLGGEEFGVLLVDADAAHAQAVGERLRADCALAPLERPGHAALDFTISIGLATAQREDTPEALLARADAALYEAKRAGRNRLSVAP